MSVGCVTERGCVVLDQPQQLANLLRLVRRTQPRSDGNGTVNLGMHRRPRGEQKAQIVTVRSMALPSGPEVRTPSTTQGCTGINASH